MKKNTIFRQTLQYVPRYIFETIENHHYDGRKRQMNPWTQFLALLFGQLSGCVSLRHICEVLDSHQEKYYHHGMNRVTKSSLSRATAEFSYKIFEELFYTLLTRCQKEMPGHNFKFKNRLYSFDSTTIVLCYKLFSWAKFRQSKAGIKLHTQLDSNGHIPVFVGISSAKSHDSQKAHLMRVSKGDVVTFDRGYCDYKWFNVLDSKGVTFVTREKRGMKYEVIKSHPTLLKKGITSDQTIRLTGSKRKFAPARLRRVTYYDSEKKQHYTYLTNNFELAARTIADIYKERWHIEIFFREIKQNLKIKTFIGTSENAVFSQIFIALCAYLLLKMIALKNNVSLTIGKIRRLLEVALFSKKGLLQILIGKQDSPPELKDQIAILFS